MAAMVPSHPKLVWPRSDGKPERWPVHSSANNSGWFERVKPGEPKYLLYAEKVGKHVAEEVLGLSGLKRPLIDLPEGYALYNHVKPQGDGRPNREDLYLFGSPQSKFRSPAEFNYHATWLFDQSKDLRDHNKDEPIGCGCKYNPNSDQIKAKKRKASGSTDILPPPKRMNSGSAVSTPEVPFELEEPDDLDLVVPERATDQMTQRRFRKGELVFFRIPTIAPPKGSDLPEITHWPGLVASLTQRKLSADHAKKPNHNYEHSIRPLGMFSNAAELIKDTSDLLPFAASVQLLGGLDGWFKIGQESNRVLLEGAEREALVDIPSQTDLDGAKLEERWKRRWGERIPFSDLPSNWDAAVLRLGVALRMAKSIANCWSQTDKYDMLPAGTELSPREMDDIEDQKKTLYQGLWYQGERLWNGDLVRLRRKRSALPNDSLAPPSLGAEDRGVFLRIRLISLENQPSAEHGVEIWRCMLYGDLYELSSTPVTATLAQIPELPPPKDFHWRRINADSCEVTVDIFDVAGRAYPDLLTDSSAWFYPASAPEGARHGVVEASISILELVGLTPSTRTCDCNTWKDDLYVMVRDATRHIERSAREHYGKLLFKAMGFKAKDAATPVRNGMSSAATTPRGGTPTPAPKAKTPIFQCDPADVTIIPSSGNRLQSPAIAAAGRLKTALDVAAAHLRAGRTVAFPTETVYGLGANSLDKTATDKIYAIKNRPSDNPLIWHISTLDMLQRLLPVGFNMSELYFALIDAFWPGPLTLLFPNPNPPAPPAPQTNAIRMPNHPLALALIAAADLPVSAPSANSSGRPSPTRAAHVAHDLDGADGLGCILDGGACGVGVESTVVDALAWQRGGGGSVNVLRPGGLGVEDVARVVKEVDAKFGGETAILIQGKSWKKGTLNGGRIAPKDDSLPPSTPGMKYRHYSPAIPVHLLLPSNVFPRPPVTGPTTDPAGVVTALSGGQRVGFLHFDNSPLSTALSQVEGLQLERRSLGADASSAAQHLFDGLLALEEAGVSAILVEGCADDGLGLAVMERVGKAVGGGGVTGALGNGEVSTPGQEGRYWVEV